MATKSHIAKDGDSSVIKVSPQSPPRSDAMELQRTLGNQAFGRLIGASSRSRGLESLNGGLGSKSNVAVAASGVQHKCAYDGSATKCDNCQEGPEQVLQRSASTPGAPHHAPPIVGEVLGSPGRPLDAATRAFMEPRFGHDFSNVRVHTDAHAAAAAASIQADAYTTGKDIYFAAERYRPATPDGMRLLAHEAAHTLQQRSGNPVRVLNDESLEAEAHAAQNRLVSAEPAGSISHGVADGVQRSVSVDVLSASLTPALARELTDAELEAQANLVRGHLAALTASTPESAAIQENLNVLENEVQRRMAAAAAPAQTATRFSTPQEDVSAAESTQTGASSTVGLSSTPVLAAAVAPLGLPGGGGAPLGGLPESAFRFGQIAGETPLNPAFGAASETALGTVETAGSVAETAGLAGEAALGAGETVAAVAETAAITTAAEETAVVGTVLAVEGAIPVAGWIALGVTVAAIGIYLGARYVLSDDRKPVRPLTPDEGQRVLPPTPVPHQAPGPEGQNNTPAVDPGSGEQLYTPAPEGSAVGIDPVTGERLYTPGPQSDEPLEAAPRRRGDQESGGTEPIRTPDEARQGRRSGGGSKINLRKAFTQYINNHPEVVHHSDARNFDDLFDRFSEWVQDPGRNHLHYAKPDEIEIGIQEWAEEELSRRQ